MTQLELNLITPPPTRVYAMVENKLAKWEIDPHFSVNEAINMVAEAENITTSILVSIK